MTTYTPTDLARFNTISPELASHVQRRAFDRNRAQTHQAQREERAAHLAKLRHLTPYTTPIPDEVSEHDTFIPALRDAHPIRVRVYTPTNPPASGCPIVVLFHEGGWTMGDLSDEDFNARLVAKEHGAIGVNVEYRLGPEWKFPVGVMDCWSVVKAVAEKPELFDGGKGIAKPELGIVLGGSSAGGNISSVLAHVARQEGLRWPVTGQWLSVPFIVPDVLVPEKYRSMFVSMDVNVDDPVIGGFTNDGMKTRLELLGIEDEDDPWWSAFASKNYPPTKENQEGKAPLARAFFQVGGMDPLRDHAIVYEKALREEWGVETRMKIYGGYCHMFWTNWPEMEMTQTFFKDLVEGMGWLLRK